MRQNGQGRVCILSALKVIDELGMLGLGLVHLRAVGHLVNLLVKDALIELICVVVHLVCLQAAQLIEVISGARLLDKRVPLKDGELAL